MRFEDLTDEKLSKILHIQVVKLENLCVIPDDNAFVYEKSESHDEATVIQYITKTNGNFTLNGESIKTASSTLASKIQKLKGINPKILFFLLSDITTKEYKELNEKYHSYSKMKNTSQELEEIKS